MSSEAAVLPTTWLNVLYGADSGLGAAMSPVQARLDDRVRGQEQPSQVAIAN
jgi:hypothetical protein